MNAGWDSTARVGMDFAFLYLFGFVVMVLILINFVNAGAKTAEDIRPQGNVIVELFWDDALGADVDLWVQGPGDIPVGYSNKGGVVFNLLRDDLGRTFDVSGKNYEISYSRGIPPGEYIVNAALYNAKGDRVPISARSVVSVKKSEAEPAHQVLSTNLKLHYTNQEVTVFRFRLGEDGTFDPASVHRTPVRLWSIRQEGKR